MKRPDWLSLWVIAAVVLGLAGMAALNLATFLGGGGNPTLVAVVLVLDALLLMASIAVALWFAQRYE